MRILFAGSPAIAVPSLLRLETSHEIVGVLTNPDAEKGRGKRVEPTDVAIASESLSAGRVSRGLPPIPVLKPERLLAEARDAVAALKPDLLVVVAYGRIFGPKFLSLFPKGGINLHPSLLPKYRGCAPIPAAILNRDTETAVSVQRLALEMDSGDILGVELIPLTGEETTESLSAFVAERGAALVNSVVDSIAAGVVPAKVQDHGAASYCGMLRKEDGRLDWSRSALALDARIRAFFPWPGAFTTHGAHKLNILDARPYAGPLFTSSSGAEAGTVLGVDKSSGILVQTGDGLLALRRLQYETKKPLDWRSFLNGAHDFIGSHLGAEAHETL
ncbi:MAG: methionyl-tRNA formyltransferase [Treponemataceae bacterium]